MYPEPHVGLAAPPPIAPITPITPTPSHWGILTAGDVQAEQARTLASAQQTDAAVQACAGLDPVVKTQWGVFLAALTAWCRTPMVNVWTPWMPSNAVVVTGDTGNTMMAWEAQLQGWQQRLSGLCANVAPLTQFNPQAPPGLESQVTQWLRYGAVIAGFLGTAYIVAKVAEFVPRPAPRAAPKPSPALTPPAKKNPVQLTAQQRRALDYLRRHDGWSPATRLPREDHAVLLRLSKREDRLVSYIPIGSSGMAFMITPAGLKALSETA